MTINAYIALTHPEVTVKGCLCTFTSQCVRLCSESFTVTVQRVIKYRWECDMSARLGVWAGCEGKREMAYVSTVPTPSTHSYTPAYMNLVMLCFIPLLTYCTRSYIPSHSFANLLIHSLTHSSCLFALKTFPFHTSLSQLM